LRLHATLLKDWNEKKAQEWELFTAILIGILLICEDEIRGKNIQDAEPNMEVPAHNRTCHFRAGLLWHPCSLLIRWFCQGKLGKCPTELGCDGSG
jgi:hypothetical protein